LYALGLLNNGRLQHPDSEATVTVAARAVRVKNCRRMMMGTNASIRQTVNSPPKAVPIESEKLGGWATLVKTDDGPQDSS
jgi:hypothetical protein